MKFDVNKVLADLRFNVQEALRVSYQPETGDTAEGTKALLLEIAEDFDNLDASLQRDGSLPDAWVTKRGTFYGGCGTLGCSDCRPLFDEQNNEIAGTS